MTATWYIKCDSYFRGQDTDLAIAIHNLSIDKTRFPRKVWGVIWFEAAIRASTSLLFIASFLIKISYLFLCHENWATLRGLCKTIQQPGMTGCLWILYDHCLMASCTVTFPFLFQFSHKGIHSSFECYDVFHHVRHYFHDFKMPKMPGTVTASPFNNLSFRISSSASIIIQTPHFCVSELHCSWNMKGKHLRYVKKNTYGVRIACHSLMIGQLKVAHES